MNVSVIVTTVGGPWLGEQLAALARQTRRPEQLVVVNNGPAGAVDDVVEAWRARLAGLQLVEDRSMSVCGHARNVGAAHAREPGLLFLDDDDVIGDRYVEAMSAALDTFELVAAAIDLDRINPAGLAGRWGDMQSDGPMTYHGFLPWVIGGALGVRADTFSRLGGFDTAFRVGEDTDFSWRAQLEAGARIGFVPEATVSYRLRSSARSAYRQARMWGSWEAFLFRRYSPRGLPRPGSQVRALLRWARPVQLFLRARSRDDRVVAARALGGCVGRAEGSIRHGFLRL